jgi:hypothetical protein
MQRSGLVVPQRFGHAYALAVALSARAAVNSAFAIWLLTRRPPWSDVFRVGSTYGLVDGTLGL